MSKKTTKKAHVEGSEGMKEFAMGLALRAGNQLINEFRALAPEQLRFTGKRQGVSIKGRKEVVTKTDVNISKFLMAKIKKRYPDHAIISEEHGNRKDKVVDPEREFTWVIDPLDGTTNFVMRHTFFTTTLAVLRYGEPYIGVIYAPYTRELFVAEKGKGARRNEMRMKVSNEKSLENSFLCFAYSHQKKSLKRAMAAYEHFEFEARSMRHFGSSSLELAFVASGRVDGMIITPPVRLWDVAAGVLMIEEAGGTITDLEGNTDDIANNGLVVSNGKIHDQILKVIKKKKI